jgi:hypothetical protein
MLLCCGSLAVHADDRVALMAGWGMDDSLIQSKDIASASALGIGWQSDFQVQWYHPWFGFGQLLLVNEWHGLRGEHNEQTYELNIYAVKPAMRFYLSETRSGNFFYEAALGVAYLDNKEFEVIKLPTHFNFAMHFAAGWHLDRAQNWDLSLRYNHYSNGYLSNPNPGLDFASLVLTYQF